MSIPEDSGPNFRHELIEYIKDQLAEGQGLDQIRQSLIEQGYEEEIIDFAAEQVAKEQKLSPADKKRKGPETKDEHVKKRFHFPLIYIAVLIAAVIVLVVLLGPEGTEEALPEEIDIFLYDSLGISPDQYDIMTSEEIYSRPEIIDTRLAEATLRKHAQNPAIAALALDDSVTGVQKTITVYGLKKKGGSIEHRTLVKIRFSAAKDVTQMTIIESLPKNLASADEILLPEGGVLVEPDPLIQWSFDAMKEGDAKTASYVILKDVSSAKTTTFSVKQKTVRPKVAGFCGDDQCTEGENYISCCSDCGCPPGFECNGITCTSADKDECKNDNDCDDGIMATIDKCEGSPKVCTNFYTTKCVNNDSYCPAKCNYTKDNDCPEPVVETGGLYANKTISTVPKILNILVQPPIPSAGSSFRIEAELEDPDGPEDLELVWAGVIELAEFYSGMEGPMLDDGGEGSESGDAEAGDGIYTIKLELNSSVDDGDYTAYVYVRDSTGNEVSARKSFAVD